MSKQSHYARVARNMLSLLVNQAGTWTVTLVLTLVAPPYLGVRLYGLYSFVGAYIGFFGLVMGLGTASYLTWRIAREPERAPALTFNTLALQFPLAALCGSVALLALPLLDARPFVLELTIISFLSSVLATLTSTCVGALGGFQIMRGPALLNLLCAVFGAGLILVCVHVHADVLVIMGCGLVTQTLTLGLTLAYTQRVIHMRPRVEPRLWPEIVKGGLPFFAWSAVLLFYWQIDIPLLKALTSDTVVGWYSAANRIISIPVFLPTIVITTILPALSRERTADSPQFRALASRSIRLVAALNIPAALGMALLAPAIPAILHYPASFAQTVPLMVILSANMPLVALDMVLGTVLIALGRQRAWTLVGVVAAVVNPLANLWAIPLTQHLYGNGAIGAALTTMLSEAIMLAGALLLRPRGVFTGGDLWYVARCALAACPVIPVILALAPGSDLGAALAVVAGALVYIAAAFPLRVVSRGELAALRALIAARAGAAASHAPALAGDTRVTDHADERAAGHVTPQAQAVALFESEGGMAMEGAQQ